MVPHIHACVGLNGSGRLAGLAPPHPPSRTSATFCRVLLPLFFGPGPIPAEDDMPALAGGTAPATIGHWVY